MLNYGIDILLVFFDVAVIGTKLGANMTPCGYDKTDFLLYKVSKEKTEGEWEVNLSCLSEFLKWNLTMLTKGVSTILS